MPNEEKTAGLQKLAEELHAKKIFNLDTPARELVALAGRYKQSGPGGEVAVNVVIIDNYFVVTPSLENATRPAELGSIRESIKGKIEGGW